MRQDADLRRRLMEEQQNRLLSELEHRNKMQRLHELRELQAREQRRQALGQLLAAQNPNLLELQQQQQQQYGRDNNSILSSLRDLSSLHDDLMLQRQQLMLRDQIQQQLQQRNNNAMSHDSQEREQGNNLLAILQQASAAGDALGGVLPPEVLSAMQAVQQQQSSNGEISDAQQLEHLLKGADGQQRGADSDIPQTTDVSSGTKKKRSLREPQDPPMTKSASKKSKSSKEESPPLKINRSPSKEESPQKIKKRRSSSKDGTTPHHRGEATTTGETENETDEANKDTEPKNDGVAKLLKLPKVPAANEQNDEKGDSEEQGGRKKSEVAEEDPPAKKGGQKKKAPEATPQEEGKEAPLSTSQEEGGKAPPATSHDEKKADEKDERADHGSKLSDHEQTVINFLGSRRGADNGKSEECSIVNGVVNRTTGGKDKGNEAKEAKARNDDEAADIILNFKGFDVSAGEVQKAKKWSRRNQQTLTTTYPVVPTEEIPFLSPGLKFNLPSLPIEPEMTESETASAGPLFTNHKPADAHVAEATNGMSSITDSSAGDEGAVRYVSQKFRPEKSGRGQDDWWPSNASIRKERRKRGVRQDDEDTDEESTGRPMPGICFVKAGIEVAKQRLATSVEPGVLEKLPHCKLYDDYCLKEKKILGKTVHTPKFCCQTTETFPLDIMVCCSACSTWRHAQCGGHYKRYTADNVDSSNILFEAICDQCYLEQRHIEVPPKAAARIDRQRTEHLRRCNGTNAVMRQVAFGKHSGQYKWPLGSVSVSHISGHTRSVQARHEKAEKQWSEMAARLGGGQELRPKERQRVRTRELERLLVSIEDAGKSIFCIEPIFSG